MPTKVVFICAPYTPKAKDPAESYKEQQGYITEAREYAITLWRCGIAVICPPLNTMHMDHMAPRDVFLDGYLELLKRSDAVLVIGDWQTHEGCLGEVALAEKLKIPVFADHLALLATV